MSITYLGAYVGIIGMLLRLAGIKVDEAEIQSILDAGVALFSTILVIYGRYRNGGVSIVGIRKSDG